MAVDDDERIQILISSDLLALVPDYLQRRESDVIEIISAVQRGDFDHIRTIGHQMKGSGAGYGFDMISDIGAKMEDEAKAEHGDQLIRLANLLADYLKKITIIPEP